MNSSFYNLLYVNQRLNTNKAFYTLLIRLTLLYRSSQWNSGNEGRQNISDSVNSDSSEDCLIESEEESDLDEDDVLKVCSCSCDEKACDSDIDEDDLNTVYVSIA